MTGRPVDALTRRQTQRTARTTTSALKALPESWVVLHDVRWPGRPFATIDHIAIGPSGVFVLDSTTCSGRVRLAGGVLRQNGRARTREVLSAHEAAAAVWRRLPHLPDAWVTPVLCVVGSDVAGWAGSVAVCHKANLVEVLTSRPTVLSPEVVHSVENDLRLQLHTNAQVTMPSRRPAEPRQPVSPLDRFRSSLAAPLAGIAFAATLAMSSQIVTGVADGMSSVFIHSGFHSDDR